jgi:tRNA dimethylallyltransferase
MSENLPAIAILGPTASGKSRLSMGLAARCGGEIVSCDALQIYRGMDIGTAKASAEDRQKIVHHMLDLRNPGEDFTAGDYQRLGREALYRICSRGHLPFVAGGTGFYLKALIDGLFEGPGRSEELRERMRKIAGRGGVDKLHRALRRVDPDSARRIMEHDVSRIVRAYEIYLISGRPMSVWQQEPRDTLRGFRWLQLGIAVPREELYGRINRRVEQMFSHGFIEEVNGLIQTYGRDCQAFKAIGYQQISRYLEGTISREQALEETQIESRHYAKRQMTWFRAQREIVWLDDRNDQEQLQQDAEEYIESFLKRQE